MCNIHPRIQRLAFAPALRPTFCNIGENLVALNVIITLSFTIIFSIAFLTIAFLENLIRSYQGSTAMIMHVVSFRAQLESVSSIRQMTYISFYFFCIYNKYI